MKKYKIGTAARHAGVTPQTIRFYESRDLIQSFKEEFSTTRYYGARHFKQLANIRKYFKQGFSETDIALLLSSQTLDEMKTLYKQKHEQCLEELAQLRTRIHSLEEQLRDMERIDTLFGQIIEEDSPEFRYLIFRHDDEIDESPNVENALAGWIENIHLIRSCSLIPLDAFIHYPDQPHRYSGYCISTKDFDQLNCPKDDPCMSVFPVRRCLHTICALTGKDISPMTVMPHVYAYMEKHHLRPDGDIFGSCIAVLDEQRNKTDYAAGATYYEYWIPVTDA